jgi:hypothetical protein
MRRVSRARPGLEDPLRSYAPPASSGCTRCAICDARAAQQQQLGSRRSTRLRSRVAREPSGRRRRLRAHRAQRSSHGAQQARTAGHRTARDQGHAQIVPDAGWSPTGSAHGGDRRSGQRGAQSGTSRHLRSPANRTRPPRAPQESVWVRAAGVWRAFCAGVPCIVDGLVSIASRVRPWWRLASTSSSACVVTH